MMFGGWELRRGEAARVIGGETHDDEEEEEEIRSKPTPQRHIPIIFTVDRK